MALLLTLVAAAAHTAASASRPSTGLKRVGAVRSRLQAQTHHPRLQLHSRLLEQSQKISTWPTRTGRVTTRFNPSESAAYAGSLSLATVQDRRRRSDSRDVVTRAAGAPALPASAQMDVVSGPPRATLVAKLRALCFYLLTGALAVPLFAVMLAIAPVVLLTDRYRRAGEHAVNAFWASASTSPLYQTEVVGLENLPGPTEPAIYVANHQSYMDIYTLLTNLPRPFKFVSKTSNFLIPIVGWSMYLTGHVGLNRMDRRSQIRLINDCRRLLEKGTQVLLFPEGTRTTTWKDVDGQSFPVMGGFKKGAFSIAKKAQVPIIPITLIGTGNLMPNGGEGLLFPGKAKLVIHPRIDTKDRDPNDLMAEARAAIASSLPPGTY